jgi:hypothetical protein
MADAASRHSDRLRNKRDSEHLASNERSTKRPKSDNAEEKKEEKEPIKLPAIVQNGLFNLSQKCLRLTSRGSMSSPV